MRFSRVLAAMCCCVPIAASAAPPTGEEIAQLCAEADDAAHCGRLIERAQLKRLPGLARRDGPALLVTLFPQGIATFADSEDPLKGRSYSLWDYLDGINAVLLYTTTGEKTSFLLLLRTSNRRYELPTEPQLSPDRQRLVTADICGPRCSNEIAVWRITRDEIRKELTWSPDPSWIDASARWKNPDTLSIEYSTAAVPMATVERKITDASWTRAP